MLNQINNDFLMIDYKNLPSIDITINNKTYNLLVAKTDEEKEYGLKGVKELDNSEGMWFSYEDAPQKELTFWMESTSLKLNIAFINENYEIIEVLKGEPNSLEYLTCIAPDNSFIIAVIELNQSENIKSGDEVEILDESDLQDLPTSKLLVLNDDGTVQFDLGSGSNRIFSRISSRVIIHKAKKAASSKSDTDYKALGRYIFKELDRQDNRDPEYVEK